MNMIGHQAICLTFNVALQTPFRHQFKVGKIIPITNFKNAVMLAWELFGEDAYRKSLGNKKIKRMINRALFEVVTTIFSKLDQKKRAVNGKKGKKCSKIYRIAK